MKPILYQVDSFTGRSFSGNPAGVCVLPSSISDESMQRIAAEVNASETAFVWPENNGFRLRWFTPTVEVDLCGHGTLAAAHILFERNVVNERREIAFHTRSGVLLARKNLGAIELDFPVREVGPVSEVPKNLVQIIGAEPIFVGVAGENLFVEIASDSELVRLQPDFVEMSKLDYHAVLVTAISSKPEYDFVSRSFAPSIGINEDPVTGSTHCSLAPYYSPRLNKLEMIGYQASRRGGFVRVKLTGNDRIVLSGEAVTIFEGSLSVEVN